MAFVLSENFKAFINTSFLLLLCFFFTSHIRSPTTIPHFVSSSSSSSTTTSNCIALQELGDAHSKCSYLKTHSPCVSQGYVNYLHMFYCLCGSHPSLGYTLLSLWLLVLFYLLGNTASQYFCSSVESLSRVLRLSPTIAGVTLLSLGNGSPDVFASIISFRSGSAEVGLSSVLGGAFFVSCVVVGVINICVASSSRAPVRIDRPSFVRDVLFFLAVLSSLFVILLVGRITIWGAACFALLYFVYVAIVSVTHLCREKKKCHHLSVPILVGSEEIDEAPVKSSATAESKQLSVADGPTRIVERHSSVFVVEMKGLAMHYLEWFLYFMDMPLYLPRRLTIPDVSDEHWSRRYAVASATLAPVLLAALWNSKRSTGIGSREGTAVYVYGASVGLVLGIVAARTTTRDGPPKKCLFPWLAGGFLMSVLWTYIIAEELVGLLVSLGYVLGIGPGILGLTVLAWGNSVGDLIANVAMAVAAGQDGAQIAISGCYAGPIFNTLAGLGGSLVASAWGAHPEAFVVPVAPALFEILGFMMGGLVWALVMVPRKGMRMDRTVGVGLLAIYLCFLCLRLCQSLGMLI